MTTLDATVVGLLEAPNLAVDGPTLFAAAIMAVGVLAAGLAQRIQVPSLLLFMGLGMLVSDDGLGLITFDNASLAQNIAVVALIVIIFEGGLSTSVNKVRPVIGQAVVLATFGVMITMAIVAGATLLLLDVSGHTAFMIGAVVASTDAAAVFAVSRRLAVPTRTQTLLEAESGMNDPMAALLTIGVIEASLQPVGPANWLLFGLVQISGGLAAGLAIGILGGLLLHRVSLSSPSLHPILAAAAGFGAYGAATAIDGSGFLAVYVAGVTVSALAPRHRHNIRQFHEGLAEAAQMGLFFLLGALVFPDELPSVAGEAVVITIALVLVARPVAVFASIGAWRWPGRELTFISWAGLRGAVPIVLATYPLTAGISDSTLIFNIVFVVVIISVSVQGTTLPYAGRKLGLSREPGATSVAVEVAPMGSIEADVAEVILSDEAGVIGRTLAATPPPEGVKVLLISRAGTTFVPDGTTVLLPKDHLVLGAREGELDSDQIREWLTTGEPAG